MMRFAVRELSYAILKLLHRLHPSALLHPYAPIRPLHSNAQILFLDCDAVYASAYSLTPLAETRQCAMKAPTLIYSCAKLMRFLCKKAESLVRAVILIGEYFPLQFKHER